MALRSTGFSWETGQLMSKSIESLPSRRRVFRRCAGQLMKVRASRT